MAEYNAQHLTCVYLPYRNNLLSILYLNKISNIYLYTNVNSMHQDCVRKHLVCFYAIGLILLLNLVLTMDIVLLKTMMNLLLRIRILESKLGHRHGLLFHDNHLFHRNLQNH